VALQILSQAPTMDFPLAAAATSSPKFSADHTKIIELETVSPNVIIIDNLHFCTSIFPLDAKFSLICNKLL
jgi:hypothetical protein